MPNVKFVIVDATGAIQGMGSNELGLIEAHVPEGMLWFRQDGSLGHDLEQIPVDPATLDAETVYGMVNGIFGPAEIVAVTGPTVTTAEAKSVGVAQINTSAAAVRARYITILPGQEMIYLAKESEALRYLAEAPATLDGYPMLAGEIGITAPSAYELAQLWANMAVLWRGIAAQIEAIRLAGVYAVEAAADTAGISAAVQVALDALSSI